MQFQIIPENCKMVLLVTRIFCLYTPYFTVCMPLVGPAAVAEGLTIRRTPQGVQGVSNSRLQNPQDHRVSRGSPTAAGPPPKSSKIDLNIGPRKGRLLSSKRLPSGPRGDPKILKIRLRRPSKRRLGLEKVSEKSPNLTQARKT